MEPRFEAMRSSLLLLLSALALACGGSSSTAASTPSSTGDPVRADGGALKVSTAVRRSLPRQVACGAGDVCGYFLQVMSPGSDAQALADKAVRILRGKCSGHVIVYKDARGVMGSGSVFPSLEEKRSCERALGRAEDTDFPHALVWRVAP
jgi:hypothetical protein